VLLLSTTPTALGGTNANVMGVFQLTDVAKPNHLNQVIADWTVGKAGTFGAPGTTVTLTAFVVAGTARTADGSPAGCPVRARRPAPARSCPARARHT
jgi:hypothetical protein